MMTNVPTSAFLVCGRTPSELAASVACAEGLKTVLRAAGFPCGAYRTAIPRLSRQSIDETCAALTALCAAADLVLTVGCEGFGKGSILPDVTALVCPREAAYFTGVLCGASPLVPTSPPAAVRPVGKSRPAPFSRAVAGIRDDVLVLNFSNDTPAAVSLLTALLPAVRFSVLALTGNSAEDLRAFEAAARRDFPAV